MEGEVEMEVGIEEAEEVEGEEEEEEEEVEEVVLMKVALTE